MRPAFQLLLLSIVTGLIGCVTIQSNSKPDAVPPIFRRVLIVTKMRNAPDTYVRELARTFPSGYEVCTLALSPLSFDKPDEAIRKQADDCHSEVILTLELVQAGHTGQYSRYGSGRSAGFPYEYNAEMQAVASGQPFWKAIISTNPTYGEGVPPRNLIKRLLQDHIIEGKMPKDGSLQALN